MDVALFSKIVKELLSGNDRVVIPGLGTFVAEDVPASFSNRGFTINPPYRTVSFVPGEEKDDTLAGFYATSNNIDILQAVQVINSFISELQSELETKKTVVLPEFGRVRLIGQGRIIFVQDENLEIFPQVDYLEPVSLKSLGDVNDVQPVHYDEEDAVQYTPDRKDCKRKIPVWAVVVIVLAGIAVAAVTALAIAGRMYPDFVDQFLYNDYQLEILHTQI